MTETPKDTTREWLGLKPESFPRPAFSGVQRKSTPKEGASERPKFFLQRPVKSSRTLVHRTDPLIGHAFTSDRQKGDCLDHPGLFMVKPMGVSAVGHTFKTHEAQLATRGQAPLKPRTWEERVSAPRQFLEIGSRVLSRLRRTPGRVEPLGTPSVRLG